MNICVIPARGGSKRIPRKNVRPFLGRPMIEWSVRAAEATGLFERIIVSTDDREIADVARAAGAEVPFTRPASLSDDHTGLVAVIAHAVKAAGDDCRFACAVLATAPMLRPDDLVEGRRLVEGVEAYAFSAARFPAPVQRGFTVGTGVSMMFPEYSMTRSQDLAPVYHDAGQFYWARPATWIAEAPVFQAGSTIVDLPPDRICDIDEPEDWTRAEALCRVKGIAGQTDA